MINFPSFSLRRKDQLLVVLSLSFLIMAAWVYLFKLDFEMADVNEMALAGRAWNQADFVMMLLMWIIMMIAMMVPSAVRAVLIYSGISRRAHTVGKDVASTYFFVSGYVVVWGLFSVVATTLQWKLENMELVSTMMGANNVYFGSALFISAGIYQLTPLKDVCLSHCRSPTMFFARHFRKGATGAFRMGFIHGIYCLGCCWVLMGLLFVGGVMNLLWILAISIFVIVEKLVPIGMNTGRYTGLTLMTGGLLVLLFDSALPNSILSSIMNSRIWTFSNVEYALVIDLVREDVLKWSFKGVGD